MRRYPPSVQHTQFPSHPSLPISSLHRVFDKHLPFLLLQLGGVSEQLLFLVFLVGLSKRRDKNIQHVQAVPFSTSCSFHPPTQKSRLLPGTQCAPSCCVMETDWSIPCELSQTYAFSTLPNRTHLWLSRNTCIFLLGIFLSEPTRLDCSSVDTCHLPSSTYRCGLCTWQTRFSCDSFSSLLSK